MKHLHKFTCELYGFDIIVAFHKEYKQLEKNLIKILNLKKDEIYGLEDTGAGRIIQFTDNTFLIWIRDYSPGIVAHEAFHCTHFIMDEIDCPLNYDTKEAYAYLLEYLVDKIYKLKE